jgi:hypothetical protein
VGSVVAAPRSRKSGETWGTLHAGAGGASWRRLPGLAKGARPGAPYNNQVRIPRCLQFVIAALQRMGHPAGVVVG